MLESPTHADVQSIESLIAQPSPQETTDASETVTGPQTADTGKAVDPETQQLDVQDTAPTFSFDGVTKDDNGFSFQAPTGSVYKGKTMEELWSNVAKGVAEKDQYISSLKTQKAVSADEFKNTILNPQKTQDEIRFPDRQAIYADVFKGYGIDPDMTRWTPDKWDSWAIENNVPQWQIPEYRQSLREASRVAESQYADANKRAFDAEAIAEETEAVQQLIAEEGVDVESFSPKYQEILHQIYSDPKSRNKLGMLKKGIIVLAVTKAIAQIKSGKVKAETRSAVEKEITEATKKLNQIKPEGAQRAAFSPPAPKAARSLNDAKWDLIRSLQTS